MNRCRPMHTTNHQPTLFISNTYRWTCHPAKGWQDHCSDIIHVKPASTVTFVCRKKEEIMLDWSSTTVCKAVYVDFVLFMAATNEFLLFLLPYEDDEKWIKIYVIVYTGKKKTPQRDNWEARYNV